jgi:cellulose synthase/poly-beta-1,6-N-acetylglucosamine synthase-like glycosyltransferase
VESSEPGDQGPPPILIVIDADCLLGPDALDALVRQATATGRPAQAAYTLDEPPGAGPRERLSAFAFRVKNVVRPRGLDRLGLPCLLGGTGMAFPADLLRRANLATGNIVEDMRLAVDLAAAGFPPRFCPAAEVHGEFPTGRAAATRQRQRWEHGHLKTLLTQAPRLFFAGIIRLRPSLIGLALELSVPPLSVLALAWVGAVALAGAAWGFAGSPVPLLALATGGAAAALAFGAAWWRFGRERLPLAVLLAVPWYVAGKLPIYLRFLARPERTWSRTDRTVPPAEGSAPPHGPA